MGYDRAGQGQGKEVRRGVCGGDDATDGRDRRANKIA